MMYLGKGDKKPHCSHEQPVWQQGRPLMQRPRAPTQLPSQASQPSPQTLISPSMECEEYYLSYGACYYTWCRPCPKYFTLIHLKLPTTCEVGTTMVAI